MPSRASWKRFERRVKNKYDDDDDVTFGRPFRASNHPTKLLALFNEQTNKQITNIKIRCYIIPVHEHHRVIYHTFFFFALLRKSRKSFFFLHYKMRTTTLTRAARMRTTTTVKRMSNVVKAFSGMNSIHTNHHASSFFDKKYHHRRRSIIRRLSASVADDDHDEGVKNTHKKGAVLFLSFVPLSPETSAAGVRTRDLMEGFIKAGFSDVHYACASKMDEQENREVNKQLVEKGVKFYANAIPNREDAFKTVLEECGKRNPIDVVVFDRFLAEEAYSFRVREMCADALRVLDMQDCHALRRERARIVGLESSGGSSDNSNAIERSINAKPEATDDDFAREISSIFRSDLTLVCSSAELELLHAACGVPKEKLCLAPFFETIDTNSIITPFTDRKNVFVSIGTFNHAPNVDGLRYLKKEIWPLIRGKLPNAEFHAYGATCLPKHIDELNDAKNGFFVKGFCKDIGETLSTAKVLLAPLRFGAGIKGKIIEAFKYGTPVITTPIGGEGIGVPGIFENGYDNMDAIKTNWGGTFDCVTPAAFATAAVDSFTNESLWTKQSKRGVELRNELFNKEKTIPPILEAISNKCENLRTIRNEDFIGASFWHQSNRSTDFFSRWIELKETLGKKVA